jgi:hypothetical protein
MSTPEISPQSLTSLELVCLDHDTAIAASSAGQPD